MARLITLALVAALVFGVLCLNYTKAFGVDHHFEYAAESGLPAPSGSIYFLGVGVTILSSGALGHRFGRRGSARTRSRANPAHDD